LAVLIFAATTYAQGSVGSTRGLPDSSGGMHTIEGRVYLPNGRRAGAGFAVNLEGNVTGTRRAATDGDGAFLFRSLPAAEYTVVVDGGPDYEPVRESVVIYGTTGGTNLSPTGQTMMLDLHLRPKGSADAEKMFAQFPKPAIDNYRKGMDAAHNGDSKKALEFLKQAVAAAPTFDAALRDLGLQYIKLNQMDGASETFEALLKLKPADITGQLNLGIALYNQGVAFLAQKNFDDAQKKLDASEAHLREAIKLNSPGPAAHYYLGMLLVNFKAFAEAQKEFELAISNGGENLALAHKFLGGVFISTHKNKEAADELEKYLKLDPKASDADRIKETIKGLRGKQ
jgi:Tfp pilus assembly protein PilF